MSKNFHDPRCIHCGSWKLCGKTDLDWILSQNLLRFIQRLIDHFSNQMGRKFELYFVGIELSHFDRLANQTIKAITLFVDHGEQLSAFLDGEPIFCEQARHGGFDGGQRRAKFVRHRVEQR